MNRTTILPSLEDSLVMLCCCVDPDATRVAEIEHILSHKLDWEYIVYVVTQHDIAPLLYNNISGSTHLALIPPQVLAKLKETYTTTAFKNLLLLTTYRSILKEFTSNNISTMPLKGIVLITELYHNIALRHLADIDLLVRKEDLAKAKKILNQNGFIHKYKLLLNGENQFHSIFIKKIKTFYVTVELHWDMDVPDSPFRISIHDCWERSTLIKTEECHYYALTNEDKILLYSFHVLRDRQEAKLILLKNLCDVAEIIKRNSETIHWSMLLKRAEQYKILNIVLLVLLIIEKLFALHLPDIFLEYKKRAGLKDTMIEVLMSEKIFTKRGEPVFVPGGMIIPTPNGFSPGINLRGIITTIYSTTTFKYIQTDSFIKSLKYTLLGFYRSLINYLKILNIVFNNRHKFRELMANKTKIKKELKEIEDWICNNHNQAV